MLELTEPTVVRVELDRLVAVSPTALALLTGCLKYVGEHNLIAEGSIVTPPRAPGVRNYLQRMDMIRVLLDSDEIAESIERRPAVGFRPCQHFSGEQDYAAVARSLTEALIERCETDDIARASIRICLDEMTENVVHHAATSLGGFAAAQGWKRSGEFEIGIVDLGVGIRASLTKNPAHADVSDDAQAITRALQPRVTATPERNAGIGLFITKMLLRANGGSLLVRSGYGAVIAGESGERATLEDAPMRGTLVALRARTDRPLNINAVYEQLERDHPHDHDADDD
jgi:anti-sigma regulatory factor (Ser/Thr protein kinase)